MKISLNTKNILRPFFAVALAAVMGGCLSDNASPAPVASEQFTGGEAGVGGSLARFAVNGNHLYTVDHTNLNIYDVTNPNNPQPAGAVNVGVGIETIFPYKKNLFIGSQLGMFIFSVENPATPIRLSEYRHVLACDPVVADDKYAYVTLRSENTRCNRSVNQLDIVDISNPRMPKFVKSYPMNKPKGLGIDGENLFVCDESGLNVFNAANVHSLVEKQKFQILANDVIPQKGVLMVIGADGLYQYEYLEDKVNMLSKIGIVRK